MLVFIGIQIIRVVIAFIPEEISGFIGDICRAGVRHSLFHNRPDAGLVDRLYARQDFGEPLIARVVKKKFSINSTISWNTRAWSSLFYFSDTGVSQDYLCYIMGASAFPSQLFWSFQQSAVFRHNDAVDQRKHRLQGTVCALAIVAVVALVVSVLAWLHHDKLLDILKGRKQ